MYKNECKEYLRLINQSTNKIQDLLIDIKTNIHNLEKLGYKIPKNLDTWTSENCWENLNIYFKMYQEEFNKFTIEKLEDLKKD